MSILQNIIGSWKVLLKIEFAHIRAHPVGYYKIDSITVSGTQQEMPNWIPSMFTWDMPSRVRELPGHQWTLTGLYSGAYFTVTACTSDWPGHGVRQ